MNTGYISFEVIMTSSKYGGRENFIGELNYNTKIEKNSLY